MFNKSPNDPTDSSLSGSESPSSTCDQYKDFDADEQMKLHLSQSSGSPHMALSMHQSIYQQPLAYSELGYSDHLMELH